LRACIDTFNDRELPMVVNLGDLIDTEEDSEMELASLAAMCATYARFQGERHTVLGNHDLETLTKQEFFRALRFSHCSVEGHATYYSFDRNGIHFVVLDGNFHRDGTDFACGDFRWDDAWSSEAQIAWLASDLRATRDKRTIVFCHEELVPDPRTPGDKPNPYVVHNAAPVRSILERAGTVWAVIQAHYHPGMRTIRNGIPYIGIRAMVEGAGQENNAYAIVSLYADGAMSVEGSGRQESFRIAPSRQGIQP